MKKIFISLFSFLLILTGGIFSVNSFFANANERGIVLEANDASGLITLLTNPATYNDTNVTIQLLDNVDMEGVDFSPISNLNGNFMGTFDGNGFTISNITYSSNGQYFGLFPKTTNATIKNIRFAGDIAFEFDHTNVKEIYAGVVTGYADNVKFQNVEFDSSTATNKNIDLSVYSDFNFGMLAGKVSGNPIANSDGNRANIRDCANYYGLNVNLYKQTNTYVGGFVGNMQNSFVLNTLNFGNLKLNNYIFANGDDANSNKEYLGGIVGALSGSGTELRNSCFGGTCEVASVVNALNLNKGAIFGGALDQSADKVNINFNYYTDSSLTPSGDGYVTTGDKIGKVDVINEAFLKNQNMFDEQSQNQPFDFNKVWSLHESRFHLQNFLAFNFSFNTNLSAYIERAKFKVNQSTYVDTFTSRYGLPVVIDIQLKKQYIGFFTLEKAYITDNPSFNWDDAVVQVQENEKGQETGYTITVTADATTKGTYSFNIKSQTYYCEVAVSEEALNENQGLVKIDDRDNSNPTSSIKLQFIYNSPVKKITAEKTSGSKYSFDCWKIYYRDPNGEFSTTEQPIDITDNTVSIAFGNAPFDKDFKLVAFFTDKDAINVSFGEINPKKIKSITFGGDEYLGEPIPVSPNYSKTLEIVTAANYKLNVNEFVNTMKKLYGENSTDALISANPEVNEKGETTYKFLINMRNIENIGKNSLNLPLIVEYDDSNNDDELLWLWITIPCVGAVLIAIIVFILVRRYRYGGKGGKGGKTAKVKEKKVSYKDFY